MNELKSVITWLERHSSKRTRDGMARYGIPSDDALGVTMADLKLLAKRVGRNHQLMSATSSRRPSIWRCARSASGIVRSMLLR